MTVHACLWGFFPSDIGRVVTDRGVVRAGFAIRDRRFREKGVLYLPYWEGNGGASGADCRVCACVPTFRDLGMFFGLCRGEWRVGGLICWVVRNELRDGKF
ncbi:hypothetical protein P153DRAFT_366034 [Dothidotthia symphoricarpi CBS 119687]|uniref:Uncharacterized protein n=1 Tax=Dothidotthia symphoricarpi CBS 119687 TaxID=1392245 RepID=A0A6A6AHR3_9PLEO|nr:uncharacterized protein P153DRAFT_366034 [Dothidotthia symphoricarpi CBS 119687]KAF2130447.1 hypothetical protein P153DRAFT_366034 [Dothidotthia symphoricarpi CBS 119687]